MVDWKSAAELQKESIIFTNFVHAILGLYACVLFVDLLPHHSDRISSRWEFCISLGFEWDLITRKKKFKWPLVIVFSGTLL
jgi:hypothetical protein